jgi:hypothetical protein
MSSLVLLVIQIYFLLLRLLLFFTIPKQKTLLFVILFYVPNGLKIWTICGLQREYREFD